MDLKDELELKKELRNAGASEKAIDEEINKLKEEEKKKELM